MNRFLPPLARREEEAMTIELKVDEIEWRIDKEERKQRKAPAKPAATKKEATSTTNDIGRTAHASSR